MALAVGLPPLWCSICGEPMKAEVRQTVLPGEIVLDLRLSPCQAWCALLKESP